MPDSDDALYGLFGIIREHPPQEFYALQDPGWRDPERPWQMTPVFAVNGPPQQWLHVTVGYVNAHAPFGQDGSYQAKRRLLRPATPGEVRFALLERSTDSSILPLAFLPHKIVEMAVNHGYNPHRINVESLLRQFGVQYVKYTDKRAATERASLQREYPELAQTQADILRAWNVLVLPWQAKRVLSQFE